MPSWPAPQLSDLDTELSSGSPVRPIIQPSVGQNNGTGQVVGQGTMLHIGAVAASNLMPEWLLSSCVLSIRPLVVLTEGFCPDGAWMF